MALLVLAFIVFFALVSLLKWFLENPIGLVGIPVFIWLILEIRKYMRKQLAGRLLAIATSLEDLASDFYSIDTPANMRKGEEPFYLLEGVSLSEFKSSGSDFKGRYGGLNIRLGKGIGVSLGESSGGMTKRPEESTVIDTGTALFTNQRVLFVGANHSREWELSKLIGAEVSANGVEVSIAVSNRSKTASLRGSTQNGPTPGILFAISKAYFDGGKAAAVNRSLDIADDIRNQVEEQTQKR